MMEISINLWAVLVAAVVNMVVGFLCYGPVFGKLWKKLMGFTDESMKKMKVTPNQSIAMGFVNSLVLAYVLAYFVMLTGAMGVSGAWNLTFLIWLGFLVTNTVGSFIWEGRPFKLFVLNAAEQLVALFLMTAILVLWQ